MTRVTLVYGYTCPPSTKVPSTTHERNRGDDVRFASSLGVAERTVYAAKRGVDHECRAAASPHHRRFGSSEPGIVGKKVVMQTGEFDMLLDVDENDPRACSYVSPLDQSIKHNTRR